VDDPVNDVVFTSYAHLPTADSGKFNVVTTSKYIMDVLLYFLIVHIKNFI
jgi:hypothetical protein